MSTITKQWLQQKIAEMEENRDLFPGDLDDDHGKVLAALRIALASLEAEPVAYIFKHPAGRLFWSLTDESNKGQSDVMPVYTAPPAPVYVPDEEQCKPHPVMAVKGELGFLDHFDRIISERDEDIDIGQLGSSNYEALMLAALDAFRAAMLQDAEPVQGWIPCSERMPDEYDYDIWIYSPGKGVCHGVAYAGGGEFMDDECQFKIDDATHWMPMIMPAAPQQEIK